MILQLSSLIFFIVHISIKNTISIKPDVTWDLYKNLVGLSFPYSMDLHRQNIFLANQEYVQKMNAKNLTYKLSLNHFSHLSHSEFVNDYLKSFQVNIKQRKKVQNVFKKTKNNFRPKNWVKEGKVTEIKDQGACGSCYAFSSIGAVESVHAIKKNELLSFSEQELLDCSGDYGNYGCNGGWMVSSFHYIKDHNISLESDYKYRARKQKCYVKSLSKRYSLTSFKSIKSQDENELTDVISNYNPVSIAMDAGEPSFMFYSSGIYYSSACSKHKLNHALLAVGVEKDYYLVKNSWGKSWGERGYVRLSRNKDNNCGVATAASYPII